MNLMYHGERFNSITHLVGAALALAGLVVLVVFAASQGDPWKIVSFSVYGASLFTLHLSDNDGSGDQHRPPYFGTVNWPGVLSALRDISFPGPLTFELPYLSRWPSPLRDRMLDFVRAAVGYAVLPPDAEATQRQEAMKQVVRRGRME